MKELKQGNWFRRHKILTGILGLIILISVVSASGASKTEQPKTEANQEQVSSEIEVKQVSQNAAEKYCQDAALLGKYIDLDKTSIIKVTAYNAQYNESGTKASNGNAIYDFQWVGENKESNENILFVCSVSGTEKDITLHNLAISGQVVYGPVDQQ